MEDRAHAIIAISFLLLLGTGALFVAWWVQSGQPKVKVYDIVSRYSVSGLSVQAPVQFKGIKVGSVQHLGLDPDHPSRILIRIALVANAPVTHATYAKLSTAGITGMTYVALNDGSGDRTPLRTSPHNPARIPIRPSLMGQLEQSGKALLNRSDRISKRLNALLNSDNRDRIASILTHLDQAISQLVVLEKAALPTLHALPRLTGQARQTLASSQALLDRLQQDAGLVKSVGDSAGDVVHQVSTDTLPRLNTLSDNLDHTLRHIDQLVRELRNNPQSVLFGAHGPKPGPGEPGFKASRQ